MYFAWGGANCIGLCINKESIKGNKKRNIEEILNNKQRNKDVLWLGVS